MNYTLLPGVAALARGPWAVLALLLSLLLAACGSPASDVSPTTAPPTGVELVAAVPTLSSLEATATARASITPDPTVTPAPSATPTAAPTQTPTVEPSPTAGPSPTPTLSAPAPIGVIEQAPYAESACSDKYPCNDDVEGWLDRMRVPEGFMVEYFGRIEGQPTSLAFGPDDLLYIATMDGTIYTMDDEGQSDVYLTGLMTPTGLAFEPGTDRLFVSNRVLEFNVGGESQVSVVENGQISTLISGLPCCYTSFHAANGIAFGPDGYGYVSVGARADHGEILEGPNIGEQDERDEIEASVLRFNPADGSELAPYARGFRNAYDIAFDSQGRLFLTDNMPDFGPPEEFNLVQPGGEHGYPWYDCEVCFAAPPDVDIVPPKYEFPAHTSPTGITTYQAQQFPGYFDSIFTVLWSAFPGAQKVVYFAPGGEDATDWATGFAAPIDLTVGPDGSLYVADWATGIIFRISYTG